MIHAREDYNRIQDPAKLIGRDEPVFLLRAKDRHAPQTVREWAKLQQADGNTDKCVEIAFEWADKMEQWQKENGCKLADIDSLDDANYIHQGSM